MDVAAASRALGFAATLLIVGAIPARSLLRRSWGRAEDLLAHDAAQVRLTYLAFGAALLLVLTTLFALHAQAAQLVDEGEVLARAHYTLAFGSRWGIGWKAQLAAALLAVAAWLPRQGHPRFGPRLAPIAALALVATLPLSGHARSVAMGPTLGVLVLALHLVGGGVWLGDLAILSVAGWAGPAEGRASRVERLIAKFSPLALTGAALLALSGTLVAWQTVGSLGALTGSSYGRTLLLKLGMLSLVAALGAFNWKVARPRLIDAGDDRPLRRSATLEIALGAVLLVVTAILVALPAPGLD